MDEQDLSALTELSSFNFSAGYLLGSFIFGVIGFYLFRAGKKRANTSVTFCGIALMVYPIFISNTSVVWLTGAALSALSYYFLNQPES